MARKPLTNEQKVRRYKKLAPHTIDQLESALEIEGGTFNAVVKVRGIRGHQVRVIVRARSSIPEAWAMSVLFDNERIDGIDYEQVVKDHRGEKHNCSGWHRHIWKPHEGADKFKECIKAFAPTSFREFVRLGFGILNVELRRGGHDASGQLRLN